MRSQVLYQAAQNSHRLVCIVLTPDGHMSSQTYFLDCMHDPERWAETVSLKVLKNTLYAYRLVPYCQPAALITHLETVYFFKRNNAYVKHSALAL